MSGRSFLRAAGLSLLLLLLPPEEEMPMPFPENQFLGLFRKEYTVQPLPASIATYEHLIREAARRINWDWRLVAAIIYHESRFNHVAQSDKGATGLMQIHSERYSTDTLLIPAVNLSIGTAYLKRLEGMFHAASPADTLKFTLAAFNMGDGKLKRLVHAADSSGLDATRWEEVASLLPEGHHTASYVENVLNTFNDYSRKYPR